MSQPANQEGASSIEQGSEYLSTFTIQYCCPGCGKFIYGRYFTCNTNECKLNVTLEVTQITDEFEQQLFKSLEYFCDTTLKNYDVDRKYVVAWLLDVCISAQIYSPSTLALVKKTLLSALKSNATECCTVEFLQVLVKLITAALSTKVTQTIIKQRIHTRLYLTFYNLAVFVN